jgi:hypothetical protein
MDEETKQLLKENASKKKRNVKPTREVIKERICNKIVAALVSKNVDDALWLTAELFAYELKNTAAGDREMKQALSSFSKLLVDMKKAAGPVSDNDKQQLLNELLDFIQPPKKKP